MEILKTKEELRNLIDAYALLSDEKKISKVVGLFTFDTVINLKSMGIWPGRYPVEKTWKSI